MEGKWQLTESGTCLYYFNDSKAQGHLACFDWIDTLIQAKSGDSTPREVDDWVFTFDSVPTVLNDLNAKGWRVIIFSNYSHLRDLEANAKLFQARAESMFARLNFRPSMFISMKKDNYSKPKTGMWELYLSLSKVIVLPTSFYCGDKAGSLAKEAARSHGDTDLLFARNTGLTFYDPEEIFPPNAWPALTGNKEMIILVGIQGAGKSTVTARLVKEHPYVVIERKKGTHEKKVDSSLAAGKSVIFDATSGTVEARAPLIAQAKKYGFTPIIFWLSRSGAERNKYRTDKKPIPAVAQSKYIKDFQEPTVAEGAIIYRIN